MLNLALKDLLIQKKSILIAAFYILFFVIMFQSSGNVMFTGAIIAFTYILGMGAFVHDDKNKADIMLNSLPVRRKHVVVAKYISLFLFMAIGTIAYMLFYSIFTVANIPLKMYPITFEGLVGAFFAVCLMNSIYFPVLFKVGYARAKVLNMVIFFAFFFGVPALINLAAKNTDIKFAAAAIRFINNQSDAFIGLCVIAVSFIILLASYLISCSLYKKRDF